VRPLRERGERGQILPLFALFLVVLIGFAALAIDVSGAYSARRFYRSVADGASLAGAQDLQQTGSRAVAAADRIRARQHAMQHVVTELGITGTLPAACATAADVDVTDACVLPNTNYHLSIRAGAYGGQLAPIACSECDPARSVQVGLRNANFGLTFSRVFAQSSWNVGVTSVAGLVWSKSYAVVTLRPPAKLGSTYDVKDIKLDGGTHVTVSNGDVATNADMVFTGSGTSLTVDPGFNMYYADWTGGQGWPSPPTGVKIFDYVRDANYVYPAMRGILGSATCTSGPADCAPTFAGDSTEPACLGPGVNPACTNAFDDPTGAGSCGVEANYLKTSVYAFMATQDPKTVYCYKPGIYAPTKNSDLLVVKTGTVALFMPGAYYFQKNNGGLQVQNGGRLLGGYRPGQAGVALMFDECSNQCVFNGTGAETIALNAGTKYPPGTPGVAALAARDWNDQPVETTGPSAPTPHILMTLLVTKDTNGPGGTQGCTVPAYPGQEPNPCDASKNRTLNLAGGGSLDIEGVQYAPTDNIEIHGGSTGTGTVGQIWVWTIFYSGGTQINQEGAGSLGPGTLRLDSACTAPGTPCNP
jgi:hypothetical protein